MGKWKQYFCHERGEIFIVAGELWLWELRMYLHRVTDSWTEWWPRQGILNSSTLYYTKQHCSNYCLCYWYCYNCTQTVLNTYRKCEWIPQQPLCTLSDLATFWPSAAQLSNPRDITLLRITHGDQSAPTLMAVGNRHWSGPRATGITSLPSAYSKGKVLYSDLFVVRSTPPQFWG